jgi:DNA-binding MarR family transcriptional regulator
VPLVPLAEHARMTSSTGPESHDEIDTIVAAERNWRRHGWPGGPAFLAALSVIRMEQLLRQANAAVLTRYGLTHSRHEALALLYFARNHEMPMAKLGERLMVHPTSVTSTVDTLERLHLVERVPHPDDRRVTLARVTAKGRAAIEGSSKAMTHHPLNALDDEDAMELFRLLAKARAAAGDTVMSDVTLDAGVEDADNVAGRKASTTRARRRSASR